VQHSSSTRHQQQHQTSAPVITLCSCGLAIPDHCVTVHSSSTLIQWRKVLMILLVEDRWASLGFVDFTRDVVSC
jgi:hypothetical protein